MSVNRIVKKDFWLCSSDCEADLLYCNCSNKNTGIVQWEPHSLASNFAYYKNIATLASNFAYCKNIATLASNFAYCKNIATLASNFAYCKNIATLASNFAYCKNIATLASNFAYYKNTASLDSPNWLFFGIWLYCSTHGRSQHLTEITKFTVSSWKNVSATHRLRFCW